ncbi:MAG: saccharopine dehydrogenase [Halieaceae bacterium]|nr:saccharopine dehydrogenase [Halieaceae bacterium]
MTKERELDIIVYGATGFTGQLVCEHLNNTYGVNGDYKWAMAGRSHEKLTKVRDELGFDASLPLIVADSGDTGALESMVASTRVLLTTVGPYTLYGTEVVKACADCGTDYVDLCGEPLWMKSMVDAFDATARENGARIVFSCGFDSIPFEMGVFFVQNAALEKFGHALPRVKGRVRSLQGSASGGTVASFGATMAAVQENPEEIGNLTNPHLLAGGSGAGQPAGDANLYEDDLGSWSGPFFMATINTKNVHRSNMLLGHAYGDDFVYDEMQLLGPEEPVAGQAGGEDLAFDMSLQPGDGPSKEEQDAGFYNVAFFAQGNSGEAITATVTGDKDPGYGSTSKIIAEAAICLLQNTSTKGGVLTSAPAMGMALVERLTANAGMGFSID